MLAKNESASNLGVRLSPLAKKIVLTLLYHEVFSHPMTLGEIQQRTNAENLSPALVKDAVEELVNRGLVLKMDGYYMTKRRPDWIRTREAATAQCHRVEAKALRRARLISKFPFVRAVFFSGTFAKGLMLPSGDVDFFIITSSNRLWLARTLLILFKKIFLLNSRKYFCVNYFVDEQHLLIEEKNLFTATEITTLRPVYGKKLYAKFCQQNTWVLKYYPNFESRIRHARELKPNALKRQLEKILAADIGEKLDHFFYRKTLKFWRRKFDWMDEATFQIALKSKSYLSKHHPNNFQKRVLKKFHFAIEEFEKLHGVRIRLLDVA